MKKRYLRNVIFTLLLSVFLSGCQSRLEKDARHLANIHRQKSETVRKMLSCNDSTQKIQFLEEINSLEVLFSEVHKKCIDNYSDSLERLEFEGYYRECLKIEKYN